MTVRFAAALAAVLATAGCKESINLPGPVRPVWLANTDCSPDASEEPDADWLIYEPTFAGQAELRRFDTEPSVAAGITTTLEDGSEFCQPVWFRHMELRLVVDDLRMDFAGYHVDYINDDGERVWWLEGEHVGGDLPDDTCTGLITLYEQHDPSTGSTEGSIDIRCANTANVDTGLSNYDQVVSW